MKLGDLVVDEVTGFAGTMTARSEYLDGSVKVLVEARHPTDIKERWIPEHRLSPTDSLPDHGTYA